MRTLFREHGTKLFVALAVAFLTLILFTRAMDRDLNHDEHQFLAPGSLLARHGLLPYRDYPLFHLPNLVFLYAGLDRLFGNLIFSAKCFSVLCTTAALTAIGLVAATPNRRTAQTRWGAALLAVAFLLFDPLFLFTTGKTWNHEAPAALIVLGILFHVEAARRTSFWLGACSGLCVGSAAGMRLTFGPLLLPFFAILWFLPISFTARARLGAAWSAGAALGLAPSAYFFFAHHEAFVFDNVQFPRLRLLDPENSRIRKTMSWWRKARYFFKEIVLPSWPLFTAFALIAVAPAIQWWKQRSHATLPFALLGLAIPFALLGCFAPSRYQYQHFYGVIMLVGFAVAYGIAALTTFRSRMSLALLLLAIVSTGSALLGFYDRKISAREYFNVALLIRPEEWFPRRALATGNAVKAHVPSGPILTLAPAWPLEAGLSIYPEFATGPFAWRSARFVEPANRSRLGFVAPDDLPSFLRRRPPAAIWTGWEEPELEKEFISFAGANSFSPVRLTKGRILWLPPKTAHQAEP
jgi:hypothetical protein